jgi:hypothetical protein
MTLVLVFLRLLYIILMFTKHGHLFFIFVLIMVVSNTDTCHVEFPKLEALNILCEFVMHH